MITQLQDDLCNEVIKHKPKGVLIDISSLDVVDSFIVRMFVNISLLVKTLGAEIVITGIKPAVAITIVKLGLSMENIKTALNVEKGIDYLNKMNNSN